MDCGGGGGCPRCPPGMGCRSTLDCNGTVSAGVLAQLAAFQYAGPRILCTASSAALLGPGAASGGTCTDARLSLSVYGNATALPMVGFSLAFSGVPTAALGALMARVASQAAFDAVSNVTSLTVPGLSPDSFILEAASESRQRRRLQPANGTVLTVPTSSPVFSMRLLLAPGANATSTSLVLRGVAPALAQTASTSAALQIAAAGLPSLRNYSVALNATVQGPIGSPAGTGFVVSAPLPVLVEFKNPLGTSGGGPTAAGGDGGGGGGAGGAIVVIVLLLGVGAGFTLCRMRGSFFGCRCTAMATCCGKFPLKGAAFKGHREAADTLAVLHGAVSAAPPLKAAAPSSLRRGSQLAFDTASVHIVVSPLNVARAGAIVAAMTASSSSAVTTARPAAAEAGAAGPSAPGAGAAKAAGKASFAPAGVGASAGVSAGAHASRSGKPSPLAHHESAVNIQKVFRGFRSRRTNKFDRMVRVAGRAMLSAAPGSEALSAAQALQRAAASASRTEVKAAQSSVLARFAAGRAGRAPMTDLEAALMVQRVYKGLKVRQALRGWTKVVDSDGDVFFRNGATGSLEWALPDVPFRRGDAKGGGGGGGSGGGGGGGGSEKDYTETDADGVVWNLDGPGGKRLKQGWRRDEDETVRCASARARARVNDACVASRSSLASPPLRSPRLPLTSLSCLLAVPQDVWYVGPDGESAWVAPLQDAFETDGPGGRRLKAGWRRCSDDEGDVWCVFSWLRLVSLCALLLTSRSLLFRHSRAGTRTRTARVPGSRRTRTRMAASSSMGASSRRAGSAAATTRATS